MKTPSIKALRDMLWLVIPLAVGVLLNAVVRPLLAGRLDGEKIVTGAGVRGRDIRWVFDEATQAAHPWTTGFLETSDGVIALATLAIIAALGLWRWLIVSPAD